MITENIEIRNLLSGGIETIAMSRINAFGKRMYVLKTPFMVYSGLTGALGAATFKGNQDAKRLTKWRDKMIDHLGGQANHEAYLNSMADFGTLLHECTVRIKEKGLLNWNEEQDYATAFFENSAKQNGISPNAEIVRTQVFEYCKSAASILQFFYDNVIDVYSIEGMCKSDVLRIATPIDLVCRIKEKKGESVVTINIKTSSQIGYHQMEQCAVEKYMWNVTYPDCQATKTAIIRPKDWSIKKGLPTYEYEVIEDDEVLCADAVKRLNLVRENPRSTYLNFPNNILSFVGETKLGEQPKIQSKSLEEMFTK